MYGLFVQVFKSDDIREASFPNLVLISRTREELNGMAEINIELAKRNADSVRQMDDNDDLYDIVVEPIGESRVAVNLVEKESKKVLWSTKVFVIEI